MAFTQEAKEAQYGKITASVYDNILIRYHNQDINKWPNKTRIHVYCWPVLWKHHNKCHKLLGCHEPYFFHGYLNAPQPFTDSRPVIGRAVRPSTLHVSLSLSVRNRLNRAWGLYNQILLVPGCNRTKHTSWWGFLPSRVCMWYWLLCFLLATQTDLLCGYVKNQSAHSKALQRQDYFMRAIASVLVCKR